MSLCILRARAMELISRGMGQNLRRSARATYLENAYGSATHRVLSDGDEMVDELGTRPRVCSRAAADLISVPWHPMPRLGDRDRVACQESQRSLAPFLQDADVTSEQSDADTRRGGS